MNRPNNPDHSVSNIADEPESVMAIKERIENARKEAMDAYSLAQKQANAQFWGQRRFKAATAAMQGIITHRIWHATDVAKEAVKYADALIEELKKTQSGEQ